MSEITSPNGGAIAAGLSADGSTVIGSADNPDHDREAFIWTPDTGMDFIGDLSGGDTYSQATAISADGAVVVGSSKSAYGAYAYTGKEAYRWTKTTDMVGLGDFDGGELYSLAYGVTADGSTIVGFGTKEDSRDAFIWDAATGMRDLKGVLESEYGLNVGDWRLVSARGISDDGSVIVGEGYNPQGVYEGWVATIPEPATLSLLAIACLPLLRRRKR